MLKSFIKKQFEKLDVVKAAKAQLAAVNVDVSFDEFCAEVQNCIKEQQGFDSFPCKVARYGHILSAEEVKTALEKKAGILRHIPWVAKKIEETAKVCDGKASDAFFAETCSTEQGKEDVVYIYFDLFKAKWWAVDFEERNWRLVLRQLVRHEYRHVAQILELRKRGGSEYVKKAFDAHMRVNMFNYKSDPMEADAYKNQKYAPSDQSEIGEAVDKIIANF